MTKWQRLLSLNWRGKHRGKLDKASEEETSESVEIGPMPELRNAINGTAMRRCASSTDLRGVAAERVGGRRSLPLSVNLAHHTSFVQHRPRRIRHSDKRPPALNETHSTNEVMDTSTSLKSITESISPETEPRIHAAHETNEHVIAQPTPHSLQDSENLSHLMHFANSSSDFFDDLDEDDSTSHLGERHTTGVDWQMSDSPLTESMVETPTIGTLYDAEYGFSTGTADSSDSLMSLQPDQVLNLLRPRISDASPTRLSRGNAKYKTRESLSMPAYSASQEMRLFSAREEIVSSHGENSIGGLRPQEILPSGVERLFQAYTPQATSQSQPNQTPFQRSSAPSPSPSYGRRALFPDLAKASPKHAYARSPPVSAIALPTGHSASPISSARPRTHSIAAPLAPPPARSSRIPRLMSLSSQSSVFHFHKSETAMLAAERGSGPTFSNRTS